jgi:hypothetical protein
MVDVETWPTHAMYDNGVTCIFRQGSRSSIWDKNIVMANLHYVGVLKEMIIVSYINQHVTLMKCSWIPIHTQWNATIVWQYEHGFWVVNHGQWVDANLKPYVLPTMVSQVWFNHDHNACKTYSIGQEISKVMYIYEGWPHLV